MKNNTDPLNIHQSNQHSNRGTVSAQGSADAEGFSSTDAEGSHAEGSVDVIIIGAGAAGLMTAITAGQRNRRVLVIDHSNKPGKKILMSGGGRCNFTHLQSTPENFISENPHFCKSALSNFTPFHFLEMVEQHNIAYVEKTAGQLFCQDSSKAILNLLLTECTKANVALQLNTSIKSVKKQEKGFTLSLEKKASSKNATGTRVKINCSSLVIATGGLSIPTLGASGFGYQLAEQFGLSVLPRQAALVPFTLQPALKEKLEPLAGLSLDVSAKCISPKYGHGKTFAEPMLITHRGLSGPAILQASLAWQPGATLALNCWPAGDFKAELTALRAKSPQARIEKLLNQRFAKRLCAQLCDLFGWKSPLQEYSQAEIKKMAQQLENWCIKPSGTEGYRTAEVTLGGINTKHFSSKTLQCNSVDGLYCVGEVLDVTGELGGHNFQWAWASGFAAGQHC